MRRFATMTGAVRGGADHDQPFSAMNTTPLIDVLLVLLIMFILTIPAAMTKLPVNLPQPGPAAASVVHQLVLARDGTVTLDGAQVGAAALSARLRTIATVGDTLNVRTDPAARYDDFAGMLGVVKRAGVTRLGFAPTATREF